MLGQNRDLISVPGPDCFVYWKKLTKQKQTTTTRAPSLTFVYRCCYLLYLVRNMFTMWLMKLILLLHDSCSMWFHAWCCNTENIVHMCIWNSVSTLGFTIVLKQKFQMHICIHLRNELFVKINRLLYFQTTKSILSTFWNLWKSCS